jgi:hypothetical protein
LEWSETREEAYETTLYVNNKHFVGGRAPNSHANVAWVFGQQTEDGSNGPSSARYAACPPADSNAGRGPKSMSRKWKA